MLKENVLAIIRGVEYLAVSDFNKFDSEEDDEKIFDDGYKTGYLEAIEDVKKNIEKALTVE